MCGNDKVTIYDVEKGKVLFEYNHGENEIQYFSGFDGGYKLVKYSTNAGAPILLISIKVKDVSSP